MLASLLLLRLLFWVDPVDRQQRQTEVADLGEQAVQGRLVDDRAVEEGGAVGLGVRVMPSNRAAQRGPRCPLSRISYRPAPCPWPADVSVIALLSLAAAFGMTAR